MKDFAVLLFLLSSVAVAAPSLRTEVRIRNSKCEFVATNAVGLEDDVIFWPVLKDDAGKVVHDGRHMVWEVAYTAAPPWFQAGRVSDGMTLGQKASFAVGASDYELGRTFTIVTADKMAGLVSPPVEVHVEKDSTHLCH